MPGDEAMTSLFIMLFHIIIGALTDSQRFGVTGDMHVFIQMNLNCNGSENHLRDCISLPPDSARCVDIGRSAYVVCQGTYYNKYSVISCLHFVLVDPSIGNARCSDGEVRLIGGSNVREGRVEVCLNRVWGTVCLEQFSDDDAEVVCSQMNFERDGRSMQAQSC